MTSPADFLPAIDVAEYQGQIDHGAVKASGVELAITKLHNQRQVDPTAKRNVDGFEAAGVKLAGYWYAHDRGADPAKQAAADLGWALHLAPGNVFVMADIEEGENPPAPASRDWWNTYIDALPRTTWLYGGAYYLGLFDQSLVSQFPVITAAYPRQLAAPAPPLWPADALALPQPQWPRRFQWAGHQFWSSGHVPGVPALCDINIIHRSAVPGAFDLAAIAALVTEYRALTLSEVAAGGTIFPLYAAATSFWQRELGITDTGVFGPETTAATKTFQSWYRGAQGTKGVTDDAFLLPVTGVVDSHTWAARLDVPA